MELNVGLNDSILYEDFSQVCERGVGRSECASFGTRRSDYIEGNDGIFRHVGENEWPAEKLG